MSIRGLSCRVIRDLHRVPSLLMHTITCVTCALMWMCICVDMSWHFTCCHMSNIMRHMVVFWLLNALISSLFLSRVITYKEQIMHDDRIEQFTLDICTWVWNFTFVYCLCVSFGYILSFRYDQPFLICINWIILW